MRLDLAAAGALERARLHAPRCRFVLDAEPCLVRAAPARLDRAIANLLDNACKWNPPRSWPVEVRVRDGRLEVRDHGPGIARRGPAPCVRPLLPRARGPRAARAPGWGSRSCARRPRPTAAAVHAANDPGGGARLTLELPPLTMTAGRARGSEPGAPRSPARPQSPTQAPLSELLARSKAILSSPALDVRHAIDRSRSPSKGVPMSQPKPVPACSDRVYRACWRSRRSPPRARCSPAAADRRRLRTPPTPNRPGNRRPKRSSPTSPSACANTASTPKPASGPGGGHGLKVSARHRRSRPAGDGSGAEGLRSATSPNRRR